MKTLLGFVVFCLLGVFGWQVYQNSQTQPIAIIHLNDATPSRQRIPDFDALQKKSCLQEAELARAQDQMLLVWFTDKAQIGAEKTLTTPLASRQQCKAIQPPADLRQIDSANGTQLSVALDQIGVLSQHLRQQSGDNDKPVLTIITLDANDGEMNREREWRDKARQIEALCQDGVTLVIIATDAALLSHLHTYIQHPQVQVCPLGDATTCIEWGYRTARSR